MSPRLPRMFCSALSKQASKRASVCVCAYLYLFPRACVFIAVGGRFLLRAYQAGHPAARHVIAERLWEGTDGWPQDKTRAFEMFRQSAGAGHPAAQFMVAQAIMRGMPGTEKDEPKDAFNMLMASAKADFPPAKELMAGVSRYLAGLRAGGDMPGRDQCAHCRKKPEGGETALKVCSGCKAIWYCSRTCQVSRRRKETCIFQCCFCPTRPRVGGFRCPH